eukprot:359543-Chlamydomonas_euryale.AAC.9
MSRLNTTSNNFFDVPAAQHQVGAAADAADAPGAGGLVLYAPPGEALLLSSTCMPTACFMHGCMHWRGGQAHHVPLPWHAMGWYGRTPQRARFAPLSSDGAARVVRIDADRHRLRDVRQTGGSPTTGYFSSPTAF